MKNYWLLAAIGRSPAVVIAALFSNSALLFLAERIDYDCDGSVDLGFITLRISSVLAAGQVIENGVSAFLVPFFGALADATSNRKFLLLLTSAIWSGSMCLGAIILLLPPSLTSLWFYFCILVVTVLFYEPAFILLFAYLPEIAETSDGIEQLVSSQYSLHHAAQLVTAGILVALSLALEETSEDELTITAIAHFMGFAWFLAVGLTGLVRLPHRQKVKSEESSICKALSNNLKKLLSMTKTYPNLFKFYLAWTFFSAGNTAVTILQIAYVIEEFDFLVSDVGVLGALFLVFGTMGAFASKHIGRYLGLREALLLIIGVLAIATPVAPYLLRGEETAPTNTTEFTPAGCLVSEITSRKPKPFSAIFVYIFAAGNGLFTGLLLTVNQALFAQIIPGGDEATFFGFKTFFAKLLTWAPSLLFAILNEATENLQISFASLGIWFFLALPFLWSFNTATALKEIEGTLHLRRGWKVEEEAEGMNQEKPLADEKSIQLS